MGNANTTALVQEYLDNLATAQADSPADPLIRALLARAARRLRLVCAILLNRAYAPSTHDQGGAKT